VQIKTLSGSFIDGTTYTAGATEVRDEGVDPTVLVNGQVADTNGIRVDIRTGNLDGRFYLDSAFAQQTTSAASFQITGGGIAVPVGPRTSRRRVR
jgi:hypothetical protein